MGVTTLPIIRCPVCGSHGEMLHHDIRASLVYSCQMCMHEWQIDPAEEPLPADSMVAERPRTPSASSTPPRKL
jgi:DNA-directed RNA polymerase subunit RPC12/RpoP